MMFLALSLAVVVQVSDTPARAQVEENAKHYAAAAKLWEQASKENPTQLMYPLYAGNDYYRSEQFEQAVTMFKAADALGASYDFDMDYSVASCYARLGNRDQAMSWLGRALDHGYRDLAGIATDSDFTAFHSDPKFKELAATADVGKMGRVQGYRYDLWLLNRELRRIHYNPYTRYSAADFDRYVKDLAGRIPKLDDAQIAVRFKELAAMAGDGHTHVVTPMERPSPTATSLPISLYAFEEGMMVIGADAAHASLLGKRLVAVEGLPLDKAFERIDKLCSYENAM